MAVETIGLIKELNSFIYGADLQENVRIRQVRPQTAASANTTNIEHNNRNNIIKSKQTEESY